MKCTPLKIFERKRKDGCRPYLQTAKLCWIVYNHVKVAVTANAVRVGRPSTCMSLWVLEHPEVTATFSFSSIADQPPA